MSKNNQKSKQNPSLKVILQSDELLYNRIIGVIEKYAEEFGVTEIDIYGALTFVERHYFRIFNNQDDNDDAA